MQHKVPFNIVFWELPACVCNWKLPGRLGTSSLRLQLEASLSEAGSPFGSFQFLAVGSWKSLRELPVPRLSEAGSPFGSFQFLAVG